MSPLDEFEIVIRQGERGITAMVLQLNLYASESNVGLAVAAIEQKKQALLDDLGKAGILTEVVDRAHHKSRETERSRSFSVAASLALFASKAAIVIVLVTVVMGLGAGWAAHIIREDINEGRGYAAAHLKMGGHQFWTKFEKSYTGRQAQARIRPLPKSNKYCRTFASS